MAIALIGAMLRKNSSERKWKAIAEKMDKHLIMSTGMSNLEQHTLKASIELRWVEQWVWSRVWYGVGVV